MRQFGPDSAVGVGTLDGGRSSTRSDNGVGA